MTVSPTARRGVEPLLVEHDVDMVWVGHHHSFQRTCRVVNGTCLGSSVCPPELKVRTPAHTEHLGWYLEFKFRVTQADQHVRAPIHITMGTGGTSRRRDCVILLTTPLHPHWNTY